MKFNRAPLYLVSLSLLLGCSDSFNKPKDDSLKLQKIEVLIDGDLIIEGSRQLSEFIPSNPHYFPVEIKANNLRIIRNSILFTGGMNVTFVLGSFDSEGGIIQTFPQADIKAQPGEKGRSGGAIVINSKNAYGEIDFYLFGQNGGDGIQPKDLGVESNGRDGKDGKDGYGYLEEGACVHDYGLVEGGVYCSPPISLCFLNPGSGENGGDGKDGVRGGDGGNGGDSGSVKLNITGSNTLAAKYEIRAGIGGKGAPGGKGSLGGKGGKRGKLIWEYRPDLGYSETSCSGFQDGTNGRNGEQGPKGVDGAQGKKEDFCLKNFETGDYQCGF